MLGPIEQRKPDLDAYVLPRVANADVVTSVLPSEISKELVRMHLRVEMVQRTGMDLFTPASMKIEKASPDVATPSGIEFKKEDREFKGHNVEVIAMDGKLENINDFTKLERVSSVPLTWCPPPCPP